MIQQPRGTRVHERWAHLRFSVIGQLLAAPPAKGELKAAIAALAARTWQHPTTGDPVRVNGVCCCTLLLLSSEYQETRSQAGESS